MNGSSARTTRITVYPLTYHLFCCNWELLPSVGRCCSGSHGRHQPPSGLGRGDSTRTTSLPLPSLALEIVRDEGEYGVVAGLVVGLVAGDEDGEVLLGGEPGDGVPHSVAAGVGEGGAAGPRLAVGDDPAHSVFRLTGGRGMELLEGCGFDQFGFGGREVGSDELGPVSDRAMDDAGGTDCDGVVCGGAGLDGGAVGFVAARLVVLRGRTGGTEAGGGYAERAEDIFTHEVFPGFARDLLGHMAGDRDAGVGIDKLFARGRFGWFRCDALKEQSARARGCPLVQIEFDPKWILFELTGCAAAVGEELFERDGLIPGVHGFLELGKSFAQSLTPFQFSFIDEDAAEHGGHRLGIGADVDAIGGGDRVGLSARANTCDAEGNSLTVTNDSGGDAGDIVFLDDGGEKLGDILCRWGLGVDRGGDEAEQGESDGENGFHMRGFRLGCHAHRPVVRTSYRILGSSNRKSLAGLTLLEILSSPLGVLARRSGCPAQHTLCPSNALFGVQTLPVSSQRVIPAYRLSSGDSTRTTKL
jgi:hypothetical protein